MSGQDPTSTSLVLEFVRAEQAGDPFAFRFAPAEYLLRAEGGVFESLTLDWSDQLLAELAALRQPGRDPTVGQRVGERLRRTVMKAGFADCERRILTAQKEGRRVILTLRSAAAELYALPWELLTLRESGQHLGALAHVLLRYEWPTSEPAPAIAGTALPEGGRILYAWSAAGGAVPALEHRLAIEQPSSTALDPERYGCEVLAHASCDRLVAALAAAQQAGRPFASLHLLCHGGCAGTTFGIVLNGDGTGAQSAVVDAARLAQLLAPFAQTLRLVVLAACDSGNMGVLGNQLGSVAQRLHRLGLQAVVASRFPLSIPGSIRFAQVLYHELYQETASLESAILAARTALAQDATQLDWASVQLYARVLAGDDTRPLSFRPYRGLLAFQSEHRRYFFGREPELAELRRKLEALFTAQAPRFLVVAGASGTGKSSLVLAGAAPMLVGSQAAHPLKRLHSLRPSAEALLTLQSLAQEPARDQEPALIFVDQFEED